MPIYRTAKDADNPFVLVNKEFINDERLSLKAKGLMSYLLSKPDTWEFYIEEIKNHTKDKEAAITSAMKELLDNGYVRRARKRKNGKFMGGYVYEVFEVSKQEISVLGEKRGQATAYHSINKRETELYNFEVTSYEADFLTREAGQNTEGTFYRNEADEVEIKELDICGDFLPKEKEATIDTISERYYIEEYLNGEEYRENCIGKEIRTKNYKVEDEIINQESFKGEDADNKTEIGEHHIGKNTDMENHQHGEAPIWENPMLLNNELNNNNNNFNSNNDIYMSDIKASDEVKLAEYLFKHIKKNNPKAKEPNFNRWAERFKLILKNDKRELQEVKSLIKFSQENHFWYKNILSPDALRKQYDRLILEFNEQGRLNQKRENDTGTFGNYKQRTYDFDKLERRLLGWD